MSHISFITPQTLWANVLDNLLNETPLLVTPCLLTIHDILSHAFSLPRISFYMYLFFVCFPHLARNAIGKDSSSTAAGACQSLTAVELTTESGIYVSYLAVSNRLVKEHIFVAGPDARSYVFMSRLISPTAFTFWQCRVDFIAGA